MSFKAISNRALAIRKKYSELETQNYGRAWSNEEIMLGFVKDVGDLAMLIQAKEGVRKVDNVDELLSDELNDCLWAVIVLADKYGVDLEASFIAAMDKLEKRMHKQF